MPRPKANPICRATPVLTFLAASRKSSGMQRTLFVPAAGLVFAIAAFSRPSANLTHRRLINGNWKLILPHKPNTNAAAEPELYNLTKDPHETQNLAKTNPHEAKRLAKQLNELLPES